MSKLFKLKEWLTVPEAAKHLSIFFGEDVKESDVLRLALDRHFTLSLYLPQTTAAKHAGLCLAADMPTFDSALEKHLTFSVNSKEVCLSIKSYEIEYIEGVFDLLLIRGDRLAVEAECFGLESGKRFELPVGNQILVEQNGQLFCLQQHYRKNNAIAYEPGDSEIEIQGKIAINNYCNASRIPDYGVLIVRTDELRKFEEELKTEKTQTEKTLTQTERTTLLTIIAALCDYSKIKYQERGAAAQIARLTEASYAPVSEDAVSKALKKIPSAIETRMK